MKKYLLFVVFALFVLKLSAAKLPDEGMWLPMFVERLNYVDMQKMGLHLTPDELYNINNASLKDAIVGLSGGSAAEGFFCTGEIVSPQGLMFTNHHCGYDAVQKHSSLEHDYLSNGFWAASLEEELANESMVAAFLVRMENVTDSIIPLLKDEMTEFERSSKIGEIRGKLEKRASEDGRYEASVKSFYGGNEFYMFVYEIYRDVRLVGAPPSSIGKFGGDTDNWMWPRHTGDFTVFRIYTAPDGSPADYSKDNVPLKPRHFLPISLKERQKDEFAMVWGYPGQTERYLTSYGVDYMARNFNPPLIDLFGKRLEMMKLSMDSEDKIRIQFASDYAGLANAWKLFIGQNRGIQKQKVIQRKKELEEKFIAWVNADEARKEKYGTVLADIEKSYSDLGGSVKPLLYINMGLLGPDIIGFATEFSGLYDELKANGTKGKDLEEMVNSMKETAKSHFEKTHLLTDQRIMAALYQLVYEKVPVESQPEGFRQIATKYNGDFAKFASDVFATSIFACPEKMNAFLEKPSVKKLDKDPIYKFAVESQQSLMAAGMMYQGNMTNLRSGNRKFIAGLREMNPDKVYYPDANSTMRLSYGKVLDYYPTDAVHYNFITTIEGIMQKEDPANDEFIVPAKLKELYEKQDYGRYGNNGELTVCFLTTNDITGGNSGSPVINGDGQMIGLAFDGNWEAMSGDFTFEPDLQRTICVDIRYVLFVIDKYAGAKHLINELTLVE